MGYGLFVVSSQQKLTTYTTVRLCEFLIAVCAKNKQPITNQQQITNNK